MSKLVEDDAPKLRSEIIKPPFQVSAVPASTLAGMTVHMDYRYSWGPRFRVPGLPVLDRKGQSCRVINRGKMNSALVEFSDGILHVISRNALRRGK
jgi:hypothetical protein